MVKKNLTEYFEIPKEQVSVIHNAVKPFDGKNVPVEMLYKEHAKGNVLIGNIGRLSEQKGMTYFIEAAEITTRTHPEARFIIVGDGEEREQLHAQIEKKKLQNKIYCCMAARSSSAFIRLQSVTRNITIVSWGWTMCRRKA